MKTVWIFLGRMVYWLIMPVQIIILPHTQRTRILLVSGDQVLAVKGWLGNGDWQLPGGGLHRDEDPAAGARRELFEETGLQLSIEQFINAQARQFHKGLIHYPYHLFVIHLDTSEPATKRWPEIIACQWFDRNQLTESNASSDILNAIEVSGKR